MGIEFTCPQCGIEIEADDVVGGSKAQCPKCHGTVLIPRTGIQPGTTVGSYRIECKLGAGGMGEVWLAQHATMQRAVALKILSPAMTVDPEFVKRFMHEVQTTAKLEHPNIVTAFDAGHDGDIHYLAVSYVDGEEVDELLQEQGVMPEEDALLIARGVAEALEYAWDKFRMIHRDIKPANIMLTSDGVPKLMDMGISKSMAEDVQLTMTGYIVGTPHYMSPEQARGETDIDFRADVYALGATLYHMVTGTRPFRGTTVMAVLTRQITEPLESPRKRNPDVSEGCAALIEAMMAKDPRDRPGSWGEVVRDIDRALDGKMPVSRRPATGRSAVTRMTPDQLRALRTSGHPKVSARDLHEALRKPGPAPAPRSPVNPLLIASAIVLAVAGVGLTMFLAARKNDGPPPAASSEVAPAPPLAPPESAKKPDKTAETWQYATKYARDNPEEYEQAIRHFRTVKVQATGTKYQLMADAEIRRLEQAQREALAAVTAKALAALKAKAQSLADSQDFAGAAAVYAAYAGPMAKETEPERRRLAAEHEKRAQQAADEKASLLAAAADKVDPALTAAVADLLAGEPAEALAKVQVLTGESLPEAEKEQVKQAAELLQGLARAEDEVLKSFEAQIGEEVAVPLQGGVQRLKITEVSGGMVQAERQMGRATVGMPFSVRQLPAEERCRRLQERASPEVCALYAGLCAHALGADAAAAKLLTGAGVLAPMLQTAMGMEVQTQEDVLARQALAKALRPMGVVGDDLAWPAVSNQTEQVEVDRSIGNGGPGQVGGVPQGLRRNAVCSGPEGTDRAGGRVSGGSIHAARQGDVH